MLDSFILYREGTVAGKFIGCTWMTIIVETSFADHLKNLEQVEPHEIATIPERGKVRVHAVSPEKIAIDRQKIEAVKALPLPKNIPDVRSQMDRKAPEIRTSQWQVPMEMRMRSRGEHVRTTVPTAIELKKMTL